MQESCPYQNCRSPQSCCWPKLTMRKGAAGAKAGIDGCPFVEDITEAEGTGKGWGKGPKLTCWFIGQKAQWWQHVGVAEIWGFFAQPNGCKNDSSKQEINAMTLTCDNWRRSNDVPISSSIQKWQVTITTHKQIVIDSRCHWFTSIVIDSHQAAIPSNHSHQLAEVKV